jgi:hypothetical protein
MFNISDLKNTRYYQEILVRCCSAPAPKTQRIVVKNRGQLSLPLPKYSAAIFSSKSFISIVSSSSSFSISSITTNR